MFYLMLMINGNMLPVTETVVICLHVFLNFFYFFFYFREPRRSMTNVGNIFTYKSNVQHLTLTKIN